jgi:hypothetical protein
MSLGIPTRYATYAAPLVPEPDRNVLLKRDFFYPCQRCFLEFPRKDLRREPVTRLLVCPNDYDLPSVEDVQSRRLESLYYDRFDRLGIGGSIEDLP